MHSFKTGHQTFDRLENYLTIAITGQKENIKSQTSILLVDKQPIIVYPSASSKENSWK